MEIEEHIKTINKVKEFVYKKDYEGLKIYIEKREKDIKEKQNENESSEYIEKLVNNLN